MLVQGKGVVGVVHNFAQCRIVKRIKLAVEASRNMEWNTQFAHRVPDTEKTDRQRAGKGGTEGLCRGRIGTIVARAINAVGDQGALRGELFCTNPQLRIIPTMLRAA